jgi:hypothetical protein
VETIVNLPAVRPGRLAAKLLSASLLDETRELRPLLRGARTEELPEGLRLVLRLDVRTLAQLAEVIRDLADHWPFLSFRLLASPPACWLEVEGTGEATAVARAVFGELGAP